MDYHCFCLASCLSKTPPASIHPSSSSDYLFLFFVHNLFRSVRWLSFLVVWLTLWFCCFAHFSPMHFPGAGSALGRWTTTASSWTRASAAPTSDTSSASFFGYEYIRMRTQKTYQTVKARFLDMKIPRAVVHESQFCDQVVVMQCQSS